MIICTGCGKKNDDASRFCEQCGRKLQSSYKPAAPSDGPSPFLAPFTGRGADGELRLALGRMIEAWIYVLALTGTAAACAWFDVWWPLYPAVAVVGLAAWLRKV